MQTKRRIVLRMLVLDLLREASGLVPFPLAQQSKDISYLVNDLDLGFRIGVCTLLVVADGLRVVPQSHVEVTDPQTRLGKILGIV